VCIIQVTTDRKYRLAIRQTNESTVGISAIRGQDLAEIVRYIAFDNPKAAEDFGYALIDSALSLSTLPERGRFVPD